MLRGRAFYGDRVLRQRVRVSRIQRLLSVLLNSHASSGMSAERGRRHILTERELYRAIYADQLRIRVIRPFGLIVQRGYARIAAVRNAARRPHLLVVAFEVDGAALYSVDRDGRICRAARIESVENGWKTRYNKGANFFRAI